MYLARARQGNDLKQENTPRQAVFSLGTGPFVACKKFGCNLLVLLPANSPVFHLLCLVQIGEATGVLTHDAMLPSLIASSMDGRLSAVSWSTCYTKHASFRRLAKRLSNRNLTVPFSCIQKSHFRKLLMFDGLNTYVAQFILSILVGPAVICD